MNTYDVEMTDAAEEQLDEYIDYILGKFESEQAAKAVMDDAEEILKELETIAGSIHEMDNPKFKGYRRINFKRHRYAMIFRVDGNKVWIERVFHQMQDVDSLYW